MEARNPSMIKLECLSGGRHNIFRCCFVFVASVLCAYTAAAVPQVAYASSTEGTIAPTAKYAWSEAGSWFDFGTEHGSVRVTDTAVYGYAWSPEFGWVSLNCLNDDSCATVDFGVVNDSEGHLSGYAWSESAGWINFKPTSGGVVIDSSGVWNGYAWGDQLGWLSFNCLTDQSCGKVSYGLSTDWRPKSSRSPIVTEVEKIVRAARSSSGSSGSRLYSFISSLGSVIVDAGKSVVKVISSVVPGLATEETENETLTAQSLYVEAPTALSGSWNLMPEKTINDFVLAPLPTEISDLVKKFPELSSTFKKLGISKVSDLNRLSSAKFILPGLSRRAGIDGGVGVPLASLTDSEKKLLPADIVFARSGEAVDYSIALTISEDGTPTQKINTIVGETLNLAVKPDKQVSGITGYMVVSSLERKAASKAVPADSLVAAPIMAVLGMGDIASRSNSATKSATTEDKMVVQEFSYSDPDHDGIYTTEVKAPLVHGEYEIVSVVHYKDASLGNKILRLMAVIDPEGYIYEANGDKETRIPEAKVSLLQYDPSKDDYVVWPASDYEQVNPQLTDKSGTYSFLVPEGKYELTVSAPGYRDFTSQEFSVSQGGGVHMNIALTPERWWKKLMKVFGL